MATMIIKPYVDKEKDTIGLSDLGMNSFPRTSTTTEVPIIYGKYLTGFDKNAFYLDTIQDEKLKAKEIKTIEQKVKDFNSKYPHFRVDDVLVERLPDGSIKANPFYLEMLIELKAEMTVLNSDNPEHQVMMEIIKINAKHNSAFDVAPDLVTARESNKSYKFYISNTEVDVENEVIKKKELNKAITLLDTISSDDKERFLLVVKHLLPANKGLSTESDMRLYKRADDYINGIIDGEKAKGGETFYRNFIKVCEMDRDVLYNKVLIKYAIMTNIIRFNSKTKDYEYATTNQELGKTPEDIFNYLTQPKNMSILKEIDGEVKREVKIL